MRTKMSPRRALATATAMAIVPSLIFASPFVSPSQSFCNKFISQLNFTSDQHEELTYKCNQIINYDFRNTFGWLVITSILLNWPLIRWLDDRQWYREWIKNKKQ